MTDYYGREAHKPRVGQKVTYKSGKRGLVTGTITSVEGRIAYYVELGKEKSDCFIWCFKDCLNELHNWPTK